MMSTTAIITMPQQQQQQQQQQQRHYEQQLQKDNSHHDQEYQMQPHHLPQSSKRPASTAIPRKMSASSSSSPLSNNHKLMTSETVMTTNGAVTTSNLSSPNHISLSVLAPNHVTVKDGIQFSKASLTPNHAVTSNHIVTARGTADQLDLHGQSRPSIEHQMDSEADSLLREWDTSVKCRKEDSLRIRAGSFGGGAVTIKGSSANRISSGTAETKFATSASNHSKSVSNLNGSPGNMATTGKLETSSLFGSVKMVTSSRQLGSSIPSALETSALLYSPHEMSKSRTTGSSNECKKPEMGYGLHSEVSKDGAQLQVLQHPRVKKLSTSKSPLIAHVPLSFSVVSSAPRSTVSNSSLTVVGGSNSCPRVAHFDFPDVDVTQRMDTTYHVDTGSCKPHMRGLDVKVRDVMGAGNIVGGAGDGGDTSSLEDIASSSPQCFEYADCPKTGCRLFRVEFDVTGFDPDDLTIKAVGGRLTVHGVHHETFEGGRTSTNEFCRKIKLPHDVPTDDRLKCSFQGSKLIIEAAVGGSLHNLSDVCRNSTNTASSQLSAVIDQGECEPLQDAKGEDPAVTLTDQRATTAMQSADRKPGFNKPIIVTAAGGIRHLYLLADVGRVFKASDVTVRVCGEKTIVVSAEMSEEKEGSRTSAQLRREFDFPETIDRKTLRAGFTPESGVLKVTARVMRTCEGDKVLKERYSSCTMFTT